MPTVHLLYERTYKINDNIGVIIPTVREVLQNEDKYYNLVALITAMPIDLMVQLDDLGIDYTKINAWDLFLFLFESLKASDTSLIFGDLDLKSFQIMKNKENGQIVLVDEINGFVIDRAIHGRIAETLRKIHHLQKNYRKPANEEARVYLLERERAKQKRRAKASFDSNLEQLIVALVNTEQFKYNFQSVLDLSIYQFNECLRQIVKKINYDNTMHGVYSGTVSFKDVDINTLNWLSNK